MIMNNKEHKITDKYNIENYNNNKLNIKLKGINNITNMRDIFYHHFLIFQNGILIMLLI